MTSGPGPAIRRHHGRRAPRAALGAAGVALCLAAGTGVGLAGTAGPPPAATWQSGCAADCPAPVAARPPGAPVRVRVPRIGVDSPLTVLGLDRTGALVPPADFARAGWYGRGPAPGDPGPAVLAGHLDSRAGPAVFARLDELRTGDRIEVRRGDRWLPFRVTGSLRVAKDRFPTARVYGPTPGPELRLVTCGGDFDRRRGHYRDNVVVFAVADSPADLLPSSAAG
ncbi:sortase family protein [Micromonospora kangleipakensis]|uniref:Sortase family protein n=1 Tax=Micromonospora kangleipakensis TaxID=1077942 RepID=A0A4Q8BGW5_9ACTN|nr:class F sortase [Micromonospora kangleipakensis]RZU77260.1 sortase family protein [Micromonospora kangleipakensis]